MSRYPVLVFVALAFGWSWSLAPVAPELAKLGPSLAALAAAWLCGGRAGLRELVSPLLRWRVGPQWYAIAVFAPIVLWWVTFAYVAAVQRFAGFDPTRYALIVPLLAKHLLLTGLGQELGWRGFLQTELEGRQPSIGASLSVGAVWALWQAPALVLADVGAAEIAFATTLCFALSLILTFVLHATQRSLLVVALLHASASAAQDAMRAAVETLRDSPAILAVFGAYAVALALAAAFLMRRAARTA